MSDFGEPWRSKRIGNDTEVYDINNEFVYEAAYGYDVKFDHVERMVQCVNACAGMDDPVKEVEQLKRIADKYHAAMNRGLCAISHWSRQTKSESSDA